MPSYERMVRSGERRMKVQGGSVVGMGDRPMKTDDLVRHGELLRPVLRPVPVADRPPSEHPYTEDDDPGPDPFLFGEATQLAEQVISVLQPEHPPGPLLHALHRAVGAHPSLWPFRWGLRSRGPGGRTYRASACVATRSGKLFPERGSGPEAVGMPRGTSLSRLWQIALALPDSIEQDHHGRPSFRVAGRIYATVWDPTHVNIMLDEERTGSLARQSPALCREVRWGGRVACVQIDLHQARPALVRELLREAWQRRRTGRPTRTPAQGSSRRSGVGRPPKVPTCSPPPRGRRVRPGPAGPKP